MRVLTYEDLDSRKHQAAFDRVREAIERDDLRAADVKKLAGSDGYYRARLGYDARLLVRFVEHEGVRACLALEIIEKHAYERSRFLRGASVDEAKIDAEPAVDAANVEVERTRYLHPTRTQFHLLDKPLSFDDAQERIFRLPAPLLLVGTAGSGKTALALHKLRHATGDVLYTTHSAFLAQNARSIYFSHGYENEEQNVEFASHRDLLESIRVPRGREVTLADFRSFFERHKTSCKFTDAHQAFEEIRGVIGAQPEGPLARDAYLALGVRQSLFDEAQRGVLHDLFGKYRAFLDAGALYDPNLVAHEYRPLAEPRFDFVVIDEVQDLTNAELSLVLAMLRKPGQFVLAGDGNQVVHPNFFSWANVKSLFFRDPELAERQRIEVVGVNFRNARAVTRAANALLKIKHARFGSVDKESNALVSPVADEEGTVTLLPAEDRALAELDQKIARSTKFAVIVLRDEHKAEAKRRFRTPLLFSIHEAKGLEYENVVLFDLVGHARAAFAEVCSGVTREDLAKDELSYARAKDKRDTSLEVYKFFINALYVAITRAVRNVYLVERDPKHPLLSLLEIGSAANVDGVDGKASSIEEWQREARRLELQGKKEQADAIRANVLRVAPVPWPVIDRGMYATLRDKAFAPNSPFTKAKQQLHEFACFQRFDALLERLKHQAKFPPTPASQEERMAIWRRQLEPYTSKNLRDVLALADRHGADFRTYMNTTPLMLAAIAGNLPLVDALLARGARRDAVDTFGKAAFHWALRVAYRSTPPTGPQLGPLWERVAPDAVDVMVDERLVRVGRDKSEFFFLAASIALNDQLYAWRHGLTMGISTAHLLGTTIDKQGLVGIAPSVISESRKKRAYISSVLSRNEVGSTYPYSRKLWVRVRHGEYMLNPSMAVRVADNKGEDTWAPLRELLGLAVFEENWLKPAHSAL